MERNTPGASGQFSRTNSNRSWNATTIAVSIQSLGAALRSLMESLTERTSPEFMSQPSRKPVGVLCTYEQTRNATRRHHGYSYEHD
jgi:hypothetical protein